MSDKNIQEFIDSFDCNFPYHDDRRASALIEQAQAFGPRATYALMYELAYVPSDQTVSPDRLHLLLDKAVADFTHPLKSLIVDITNHLINGEEISVEEVVKNMEFIRNYPNEYGPLAILSMACDDMDDVADNLYREIMSEWYAAAQI
jgi:hypothetical protein